MGVPSLLTLSSCALCACGSEMPFRVGCFRWAGLAFSLYVWWWVSLDGFYLCPGLGSGRPWSSTFTPLRMFQLTSPQASEHGHRVFFFSIFQHSLSSDPGGQWLYQLGHPPLPILSPDPLSPGRLAIHLSPWICFSSLSWPPIPVTYHPNPQPLPRPPWSGLIIPSGPLT